MRKILILCNLSEKGIELKVKRVFQLVSYSLPCRTQPCLARLGLAAPYLTPPCLTRPYHALQFPRDYITS
jgi:hypothetical protein